MNWPRRKRLYEQRTNSCASRSNLKALFAWSENNIDKLRLKSPLVTAMNYLLSNRDGLTCYLKDGHCDISNNTAENSIRPFTVGRKNWLFSNSPREPKPVLSSTVWLKQPKPTTWTPNGIWNTFLKSCRIQQTSRMPKPWINICLGQQRPRKSAKHK